MLGMTVTVLYFAALREQSGLSEETVTTSAKTARELYEKLRVRHGLSFDAEHLQVAVNDAFGNWQSRLADGDRVAFLAPMAGG